MPLNYNPEDAVSTWPVAKADGVLIEYQAVLERVTDTTSRNSGRPMQVWDFTIYNSDGVTQDLKEYVVIPAATFKVKQLARALGREDDFKAGTFQPEDYLRASILVNLSIESQDGFDDKNKIGKYIPASSAKPTCVSPPVTLREKWRQSPLALHSVTRSNSK